MDLMRRWMKKADPEVTHSEAISPAELDVMARSVEHADFGVPDPAIDEVVAALAPPPPMPIRHALDDAPINSKIVKLKEGAILGGPSGNRLLPSGDPAHGLPVGAKIFKLAEGRYIAEQLDAVEYHPEFETDSASSAIAQFIAHFHPTS